MVRQLGGCTSDELDRSIEFRNSLELLSDNAGNEAVRSCFVAGLLKAAYLLAISILLPLLVGALAI